jgi:hypothetical protein
LQPGVAEIAAGLYVIIDIFSRCGSGRRPTFSFAFAIESRYIPVSAVPAHAQP